MADVFPSYHRALAMPAGALDPARLNSAAWRQAVFGAINLHASATALADFLREADQCGRAGPTAARARAPPRRLHDHSRVAEIAVALGDNINTEVTCGSKPVYQALTRAALSLRMGLLRLQEGRELGSTAVLEKSVSEGGTGQPRSRAAYPEQMRSARFRLLILLAMGAVGAVACGTADIGSPSPATQGPPSSVTQPSRLVDPDEFEAAIADQTRVTVNVHVPFEGTLTGTDLVIPYDQIQQQAAKLPADRKTSLAIYCRSGYMSAIAAQSLAALGYTDIVELKSGMEAWQASGRTAAS